MYEYPFGKQYLREKQNCFCIINDIQNLTAAWKFWDGQEKIAGNLAVDGCHGPWSRWLKSSWGVPFWLNGWMILNFAFRWMISWEQDDIKRIDGKQQIQILIETNRTLKTLRVNCICFFAKHGLKRNSKNWAIHELEEEVQSSRSLAQSSNTDSESEEENDPVHF